MSQIGFYITQFPTVINSLVQYTNCKVCCLCFKSHILKHAIFTIIFRGSVMLVQHPPVV